MGHEVVLLAQEVVAHAAHVSKLHVGVDVDLYDTQLDGLEVLILAGAGATVEDEEDGLVLLLVQLLLDVLLVLAEQLGVELDVTGLVDTCSVEALVYCILRLCFEVNWTAYRERCRSQRQ